MTEHFEFTTDENGKVISMNEENKKIRAWIVYPDHYEVGWCNVRLLLENGWSIYGHLCSSPGFAPGDLWLDRKERQADWKNAGLELEILGRIPLSKVPDEILEANKKGDYIEFAKKYFPQYLEKPEHPSCEVEVSE